MDAILIIHGDSICYLYCMTDMSAQHKLPNSPVTVHMKWLIKILFSRHVNIVMWQCLTAFLFRSSHIVKLSLLQTLNCLNHMLPTTPIANYSVIVAIQFNSLCTSVHIIIIRCNCKVQVQHLSSLIKASYIHSWIHTAACLDTESSATKELYNTTMCTRGNFMSSDNNDFTCPKVT